MHRQFCLHTHTHTHTPDPGTHGDTQTCQAEPSRQESLPRVGGEQGQGWETPHSVQELPGFSRGCHTGWVSCRNSQTPVNPHGGIP